MPVKLVSDHKYSPLPPDMTVVSEGPYLHKQIADGNMHPDLTPNFVDKTHAGTLCYRSVFGPFFPLPSAHLPGNGPEEYRTLIGRMIALRAPEREGYSVLLALNQKKAMRTLRTRIGLFKRHFETHMHRDSYEVAYPRWLHQPHAKRKLRERTAEEVKRVGHNDGDDNKPVQYKAKNGEILGPSKKRGIGDLGVLRTDATAYIMDSIKQAWDVPFVIRNAHIEFVKSADKLRLSEVFERLLEPGFNKFVFVYHSDDSCVGARCKDGTVNFNGDIKACDGSHRTVIFDALEKFLSVTHGLPNIHADALSRAFKYLRSKLVLRYHKDPKQKVIYEFLTMRLYSGSTITTIINNFANLCIALELERLVPNPNEVTMEEFKLAYVTAGENVGYILKQFTCSRPEQIQFLKHSPTYVGGKVVPWMNLGTYIRGFGTFDGDIPHRRRMYRQAATAFVSGVVRSRLNWGNHAFNDAFHHLIVEDQNYKPRITRVFEADREKSLGEAGVRVPLEALARRYGCEPTELEELCHHISRATLGDVVSLPLVSRIYDMDYG